MDTEDEEPRRERSRGEKSVKEVAAILGCTPQNVCDGEQKALRKMRNHPIMRELAREYGLLEAET